VTASKRLLAAAMTVAAATALLLSWTSAGAQSTGTVTVVHGVPGLTVDVYVNGKLTLEDFAPKTVTDPLQLPAGNYEIKVFAANSDPATATPAITGSATLPAGANASIVAHLTAAGAPTLSVFVNDVAPIAAGKARLVVRHTAAAPAVDVLVNGSPALTNLANPNEAKAEVPAGTYAAAVAATGTTTPVIGPANLTLQAGTAYFVYAIGSLQDKNLDLVVQTIGGLAAPPAPAPAPTMAAPISGTGPSGETPAVVWVVLGLALFGGALSLAGFRFARSHR
jgi:hypothetical protein